MTKFREVKEKFHVCMMADCMDRCMNRKMDRWMDRWMSDVVLIPNKVYCVCVYVRERKCCMKNAFWISYLPFASIAVYLLWYISPHSCVYTMRHQPKASSLVLRQWQPVVAAIILNTFFFILFFISWEDLLLNH